MQYGHPCCLATNRMAPSEYPASPAWKNGASNPGTIAGIRGSISTVRAISGIDRSIWRAGREVGSISTDMMTLQCPMSTGFVQWEP